MSLDNGLRLEFKTMLIDIARGIEQERACCKFLRFNLKAEAENGVIIFDVTRSVGTREALRSL